MRSGRKRPRRYTRTDLEPVFFEDLPLGAEWSTRGRTLTEADVSAFAGLAGDFNPLHVDADYARETHFAGTVVQGSLLAAAAIGLGSIDAPLPATVGMVGMTWRFLRPMRPGESIRARWRLARKRSVENPGWGLAVWDVHVLNAAGQDVAVGEVARLVARRQTPPAAAPAAGRRRRRGRRPPGEAAALPEPFDIEAISPDLPPTPPPQPPARRRRGRRPAAVSEAPDAEAPQAPEPGPVPAAATATAPRRRRRRRGGNGSGAGSSGAGNGGTGGPSGADAARAPAAAAAPALPGPAAPLYGEAAAQALASGPASAARGLGRALRRLRRPGG